MEHAEINEETDRKETPKHDSTEMPSSVLGCSFSNPVCRDKVDDISEFYFESDHLALKENKDYHALLRTLVILESQKIQSIQDVDKLLQVQSKAKENPLLFLESLKKGEDLGLPGPIQVAELPQIDWAKYKVNTMESEAIRRSTKRTVKLKEKFSKMTNSTGQSSTDAPRPAEAEGAKVELSSTGDYLVRGRIFQTHKPVTFNQPWTTEEQKRLEELLETFPTEETEMERWKKIAAELGNRTPVQVQSRVQKYFLKLHRAGLPIPGRLPPQRNKNRFFKTGGKKSRSNLFTSKKSTFLTSIIPEVKMEEDSRSSGSLDADFKKNNEQSELVSTDEDDGEEWPDHIKKMPEYKELRLLLRIRKEKDHELKEGTISHVGFSCSRCRQSPLLGTRWHCTECQGRTPDELGGVDLCNDCMSKEFQAGGHTLQHRMVPVRERLGNQVYMDEDYL